MKLTKIFLILIFSFQIHSLQAQSLSINPNVPENPAPDFGGLVLLGIGTLTGFTLISDEVSFDATFFPTNPNYTRLVPNFTLRKNTEDFAIELGVSNINSIQKPSSPYPSNRKTKIVRRNIQAALIYHNFGFIKNEKTKLEVGVALNSKFKVMGLTGISHQYSKRVSFSGRMYFIDREVDSEFRGSFPVAPNFQVGIRFSFGEGRSLFSIIRQNAKK